MKTRKNQSIHQDEDTSNEGDAAVSYDGKFLCRKNDYSNKLNIF
jgi:hypothetical protein